ncbi:pyrroline-5-carboxylate reductase [Afifella marina]|uniref:Pyrroline-5-carboxylate reductase n=1 Tax=Afifella marina DSM 2698 TaxID=1120955 RepID=A0A1G5P346_AFIMA|nr:pyrroline-5-carboxylate reductase [Afifella marina]MBK1624234.1 pyrroline-5-carboxylate reductase [Afifella marina DSM 2698]MBK1627967.1 pyrroline-5-carboxylate reductase [Afifella marina]MBK5918161.1 pyrroline-5-carboxylate reductase [Afifella marina]RAI19209.1 pyrroline-5-carboxylate reductase [Afifella marina DSM 2698]SCZ43569.1 pyrroline-5-carboxylate reductase [Afifella marina DSM 2698]
MTVEAPLSETGPVLLIGAGRMGGAMLEAWLSAGLRPERTIVRDPGLSPERAQELGARGVAISNGAEEVDRAPRVLVLAVKPQQMDNVLPEAALYAGKETLIISVAAGIGLGRLAKGFEASSRIVRIMPNTPAQVGAGMAVAVGNDAVSEQDRALVDALMRPTGEIAWIDDEGLIDAVTAVSGSGPAYVFHLVEAMAAAGEAAGLPAELSMQLARQTVVGGGALLAGSPLAAEELRRNVTSPGGTTQAALDVLMAEHGLVDLMREAVAAAKRRSIELG